MATPHDWIKGNEIQILTAFDMKFWMRRWIFGMKNNRYNEELHQPTLLATKTRFMPITLFLNYIFLSIKVFLLHLRIGTNDKTLLDTNDMETLGYIVLKPEWCCLCQLMIV